MIDLILIAVVLFVQALTFILYYKHNTVTFNKEVEHLDNEIKKVRGTVPVTEFEVTTEESTDSVQHMTSEEHCAYLCKKYPHAYKGYKRNKYRILERSDRYVMRLITAAEAGDLDVKIGLHTMDFSNGDEIWISNKYYGYGNLYSSKDNPHCCFSSDVGSLSLYTFMRLVDFEESFFVPVLKLKNKTIKVT